MNAGRSFIQPNPARTSQAVVRSSTHRGLPAVSLVGANRQAQLSLGQEHSLAVPGISVPALGRGCVEIIEDENPQ
jgi:hypothetical protein